METKDGNESLSAVDKFSYFKSLLYEPARSTIAGFAMTGANYAAAVQVLKKRYGKKIAIQRAHINDFLQLPPVFSDTIAKFSAMDSMEGLDNQLN